MDDLAGICRSFFDAIERQDLDAVRGLIARGAVLCRNGGAEVPLKVLAHPDVVRDMERLLGRHTYDDVRLVVGDGVVVEQHRIRSTTPGGVLIDTDVCVVLRIDADGRITRLDEYSDLDPTASR